MKNTFAAVTASLLLCVLFSAGIHAEAGKEAAAEKDKNSLYGMIEEEWEELSDEDKERLEEIYDEWEKLPPQRKAWIIVKYKQYKGMDEEEKEGILEAYEEWQKMAPHMKEKLVEKYKDFKKLSPKQRYLIKKAYEKYRKMSPLERATVRHKVKKKEVEKGEGKKEGEAVKKP